MMTLQILQGMSCPLCGQSEQLRVTTRAQLLVTDCTARATGQFEWHADDPCACPVCEAQGKVADFVEPPRRHGLHEYVVALTFDGVEETFLCQAESHTHAHEQADDAYPHCCINGIRRIPMQTEPDHSWLKPGSWVVWVDPDCGAGTKAVRVEAIGDDSGQIDSDTLVWANDGTEVLAGELRPVIPAVMPRVSH